MSGQLAERLCDGLITVPRRVLVDECGSRAGMPEPCHQLLEARASSGGKSAARVAKIVKVQVSCPCCPARLDPYPVEVRPPQARTLGTDEARLPWLGEPLQVPPNLRRQVSREGNCPATRLRLWCFRLQHTRIELSRRLDYPDLARIQVDIVSAQRDEFSPAQACQGGACGAAGLASAPGSAFGEARPGHTPSHADQGSSHRTQAGTAHSRLSRRTIVPLPAAASRLLPAVASHAIGCAEPRHDVHSPGLGAYRGRREQSSNTRMSESLPRWPCLLTAESCKLTRL